MSSSGGEARSGGGALDRALASVEREAEQPVLPGELAPWARALLDRLGALADAWKDAGPEERTQGRRAVQEDPPLAARFGHLREERRRLRSDMLELERRARRLEEEDAATAPAGSDEAREAVEQLRRDVLTWVVAARAHAAEHRTWVLEATWRDRGTVD